MTDLADQPTESPIVALIDDEPNIINSVKRLIRRLGWTVHAFTSPEQALEELSHQPVDIFISDYQMPGMNGVAMLNAFRETHPDSVRLILSGQADLEAVLNAINHSEVYRFVLKPWADEELELTLRQAMDYLELQRENVRLANTVRDQQRQIEAQAQELHRLELEAPGITAVERDEEGFIMISDEDWKSND